AVGAGAVCGVDLTPVQAVWLGGRAGEEDLVVVQQAVPAVGDGGQVAGGGGACGVGCPAGHRPGRAVPGEGKVNAVHAVEGSLATDGGGGHPFPANVQGDRREAACCRAGGGGAVDRAAAGSDQEGAGSGFEGVERVEVRGGGC